MPNGAAFSKSSLRLVRMNELIPSVPDARLRHGGDSEYFADAAVRDEAFGAVEDIAAAAPNGRRARSSRVAPSPFLGQSEAPEDLAAGEQRHVAPLLFLRAKPEDRERAERRVG